MARITVRNWKNETVRSIDLPSELFDYPLKRHLIFEAVLAYRAAGRSGTHKTKNRSEVSGGTKKLWKQKHTGRARMGDNRSPLWRHGGTVQGPEPRSYAWRMPKKMRRNALRSAIAQKHRDGKLLCIEDFALPTHRTAELEKALGGPLGIQGKALLVTLEGDRNLGLAARNNRRLKAVRALELSIVDLLEHDTLVVSEAALLRLGEVLAS